MRKTSVITIQNPTEERLEKIRQECNILDAQRKKLEAEAKKATEELEAHRREKEREIRQKECQTRHDNLLQELPEEFRSAISYYAYEQGHSAGIEEIVNHLSELVGILKEPIAKYTERLMAEN